MEITGKDPKTNAMPQLRFLAQIFKSAVVVHQRAYIQIWGTSILYNQEIADALIGLNVPEHKINIPYIRNPAATPPIGSRPAPDGFLAFHLSNTENSASIVIDFREGPAKQRFSVEFAPNDTSIPVPVEFEAAPDGTMLSEVKAEWATPLKLILADSARMRYREVKFSTKIVGLAGFDRETVNRIETQLKAKLKAALSFFLKIKGNEHIKIQFFGAFGVKLADGKTKPINEAGVLFELPFEVTEIFN